MIPRFRSWRPRCWPIYQMAYILIPPSTHQDVRLVLLKLHREDSIVVALLVPFDCWELSGYLLGLFVIDPDGVVLTCRTKGMSCWGVVHGHDIISFLDGMEDLLAGFGGVLVEMAVGVAHQDDCGRAGIGFIQWSPAERIHGSWFLAACVDFCDLIIRS